MTRSTPADRRRCSRMALGATVALVCSLVAPAARAQQVGAQAPQQVARPFHAVFGGVEGNPASTQSFDLNFSVAGQANDNLTPPGSLPVISGSSDPWFDQSLIYSSMSAQASYARRWSRGSFMASTGHGWFYYPDYNEMAGAVHTANLGMNAALSDRVGFQALQTFTYSPYYSLGMFPGSGSSGVILWNPLYGVSTERNLQMTTLLQMSGRITRRMSFGVEYGRQGIQLLDEARSFASQRVGGRLTTQMTRNLSLRAGYMLHRGDYASLYPMGTTFVQHDIDAGVDYNKTLRIGRRSNFRFSTGATIYSTMSSTFYRALVNASLSTALGRTWESHVEFVHGLQWVDGLPTPVFSDTLQGGVSGYAGRRVQFVLDAGYSNGQSALMPNGSNLDSYTGRAQVRVGLTRFAAVSANYFYYHYAFGPTFPLPPGMARELDRQSVRVGLDLWVPLLR